VKISRAELLRIGLTMKHSFEVSSKRFQEKDAVLVRLYTSEGIIGYGESGALPSPFYSPEYIDSAYQVLAQYILPDIANRSFASVEELEQTYAWIKGHHFAKIAVEGAFWHVVSQERQVPLHQVWGGTLPRVEVGNSLSIEPTVDILLGKVEVALAQGFRRIKIKIKPGFDLEPVIAIRERFGDISLMVDANSGYSLKDIALFRELDRFSLLMIEQPLEHDDIIDHAELQRQITTPICLDESILSYDDARKAIAIGACKIINIKPPRVGGFAASKRIAEYARSLNIGIWCGGMFESGIGKAFNAHLCSLPAFNLPADNSGSRSYYEHDLLADDHPIEIDQDAYITLPQAPGLGWPIDTAFIEQHITAKAKFPA